MAYCEVKIRHFRITHNNLVPPTVHSSPHPPPPLQKKKYIYIYKQKHCFHFLLDYCDTQNTSDLVVKQCLHTT